MRREGAAAKTSDPLWYKDAIIYEVHVRAFFDGNDDGVGDFRGLLTKLDYLQDLGVTAIWLLPFYPSPLKDDGYDIADYTSIHPAYGTLDDFQAFLDEAHRRGLRVITELVLNHTSDQHPWFQRARLAPPASAERDFYVWSDSPERYREARIIFQDFEQSNWSWDPIAGAYYWHRFYAHQPDLNFENPAVREAMFDVVDSWLAMGVDGLRLDAVPYLVEQHGTTSENTPRTHHLLKELRQRIDARYPDRMLLAEANQWPEDAAAYFGDGDECHMAFHFPLMPRLFMALRTEDRLPVLDIMAQTPVIPETCQWALFLRNHDELTLEMVSDEERLFMYRVFARAPEARINLGIRHRLAPLLSNSRRRIELMNALLCSLPGTPVIYYGDEIGMGDNIYLGDRDGVRTPMQWSADRNAGFSRTNPQRLYLPLIVDHEYHHESIHVEAQEQNPHSLLAYMKRLIALRKRHRAFGRGSLEILQSSNHRVLAFIRRHDDESILVVANLSRFGQAVELDLSVFRGCTPVELFGRTRFWPIDDRPYRLTLGPHAFFWFSLAPVPVQGNDPAEVAGRAHHTVPLPMIELDGKWDEVLFGKERAAVEQALPDFLRTRTWFAGTAQTILETTIIDAVRIHANTSSLYLAPIRISYVDREAETYLLNLTLVPIGPSDDPPLTIQAPIAHIRSRTDGDAVLVDAIEDGVLVDAIEEGIARQALRRVTSRDRRPVMKGTKGEVSVLWTPAGRKADAGADDLTSSFSSGQHRNSSIFFGNHLVLKLLRRIDVGINPEWEVGAALTEIGFPHVPNVLGALEYRSHRGESMTLAVMQSFVANHGNAWDFTLDALDRFLVQAVDQGVTVPKESLHNAAALLDSAGSDPPVSIAGLLEPYLPLVRLLGERTAGMHRALTHIRANPNFAPEPFTTFSQRSLYQSMRSLTARVMHSVREASPGLPEDHRAMAETILAHEHRILDRIRSVLALPIGGQKIRCHGDYNLGQVLRTDGDIVIIDFEGEPDRFIEERRLKASPLRDVAGMLWSFHHAAETAGTRYAARVSEASTEQRATINGLVLTWYRGVATEFFDAYLREAGTEQFLPKSQEERSTLLDAYLQEKALYELGYEVNHRPTQDWPRLGQVLEIFGIQQLVQGHPV